MTNAERQATATGAGLEASATIAALRDRDGAAWRSLFDKELDAIYRYVASRIGSADAEDVAAAVFEEAWKSAATLEDRGRPPRAWLFGIARNVVSRHRRRWFRRPQPLSIEAVEQMADGGAERTAALDLAEAITLIPADQAEVVTLRFLHGLSAPEVAAVLGISEDAVRGRQKRAFNSLRERLS